MDEKPAPNKWQTEARLILDLELLKLLYVAIELDRGASI